MRVAGVIVAGGAGRRAGLSGGKQLALVGEHPVLSYTLLAFDASRRIDEVVVVCHHDRVEEYRQTAIAPLGLSVPVMAVAGGAERAASVRAGLAAISSDTDLVVVHDGARPLVTATLIGDSVDALVADPALDGVVVGHPAYDTLKEVRGSHVLGTPDRARYWIAQTPQVFRAGVLREAYASALDEGLSGTDDASFVEAIGGTVAMLEGPRDNIKVTVAEDLAVVEAVLRYRARVGR